ncbi:peptidylprolyl isomerase [Dyadobacter subterraneus]|uniref:Peptidyl-prolyl cis-trans isomerase n=1 Tax=Dyadobacter subterraneus TaxID=2773304 RepID=A0ABR9WBQ3_9BACT|nr:peptidylprolyl isomerase [Dyadobacter subterraneus]MBE9462911.1 peptidylprolyl isomerase [Dyadobacter subterraneus]
MKNFKRNILLLLTGLLLSTSLVFAQKVLVETDLGNVILKLNPEKAPLTVSNFLKYVNAHRYDGAKFYRVVRMDNQADKKIKIEVIQGGLGDDSTKNFPRIKHESTNITGLKHLNGTLSMARNEPGSAGSEFFICINDQPELDFGGKRNPDGQGFAAFGTVVSGMDVIKKIQIQPTGEGEKSQTLKKAVKIIRMTVQNG